MDTLIIAGLYWIIINSNKKTQISLRDIILKRGTFAKTTPLDNQLNRSKIIFKSLNMIFLISKWRALCKMLK